MSSADALEEEQVALDVLGGCSLCGRADDHAALRQLESLEDVAQADAFLLVEPAGHAYAFPLGDVHDEPAGKRDLGRQARTLCLHRVLDGLDEDLLATADQVLNALPVPAALELRAHDLVDVEEAVLLEPDLDEGRLHARQDVVDDAEVDVPGDRAALGTLEVDLSDTIVLEYRDALLGNADRDEQLALGGRERRSPGRLASAGGTPRPGSRLLGARRLVRRRRLVRLIAAAFFACLGCSRLALAPTPAAASAPPAALGGRGFSLDRRLVCYWRKFRCFGLVGSGCLLGRLLLGRLLASEPTQGQMESPSYR